MYKNQERSPAAIIRTEGPYNVKSSYLRMWRGIVEATDGRGRFTHILRWVKSPQEGDFVCAAESLWGLYMYEWMWGPGRATLIVVEFPQTAGLLLGHIEPPPEWEWLVGRSRDLLARRLDVRVLVQPQLMPELVEVGRAA